MPGLARAGRGLAAQQKRRGRAGNVPAVVAGNKFGFPRQAAAQLGFSDAQLKSGLTVLSVGNPYSASSLLGLVSVLEISKPGDLLLMTSYGSGAGSDSFVFEVTKEIKSYPKGDVLKLFASQKNVSIEQYLHSWRWQ